MLFAFSQSNHYCPWLSAHLASLGSCKGRNVAISPHIPCAADPPSSLLVSMLTLWGRQTVWIRDNSHPHIPLGDPPESIVPRGERGPKEYRKPGRSMSNDPGRLCRASMLDFLGPVLVPRLSRVLGHRLQPRRLLRLSVQFGPSYAGCCCLLGCPGGTDFPTITSSVP